MLHSHLTTVIVEVLDLVTDQWHCQCHWLAPFAPAQAYYWWRAQAIAYIVKPNKQALQEIAIRKR
jgi:hypothetical protein